LGIALDIDGASDAHAVSHSSSKVRGGQDKHCRRPRQSVELGRVMGRPRTTRPRPSAHFDRVTCADLARGARTPRPERGNIVSPRLG
jgi:hypothetical protein